ncbi:hypothetical protein SLA2020_192710 [Shorea laevis]
MCCGSSLNYLKKPRKNQEQRGSQHPAQGSGTSSSKKRRKLARARERIGKVPEPSFHENFLGFHIKNSS